jgi:hypothetical protein
MLLLHTLRLCLHLNQPALCVYAPDACHCCRYTAAEVKQLVERRRLAGNNNTAGQYENLRAHFVVSVCILRFSSHSAEQHWQCQKEHQAQHSQYHKHCQCQLASVRAMTSRLASMRLVDAAPLSDLTHNGLLDMHLL